MMTKQKSGQLAFWLCLIVYTAICMTRNTYSSAMAEIIRQGIFPKSTAGLITSAFSLFYGVSQFFGGWIVDHTSPFTALLIGLTGCGVGNLLMALSDANFTVMMVAWSISGLSLFGSWPSIIKIMVGYIPLKDQVRARLLVPFGLSVGTMLSYVAASVLLPLTSWQGLFWLSVAVIVATTGFFLFTSRIIRRHPVAPPTPVTAVTNTEKPAPSTMKLLLSSGFFLLLIPAILRSWLETGFKQWLPTILVETYEVSTGFASMLSSILLLVNLSAIFILAALYPKRCKNMAVALALLFAPALLFTLPLVGIGRISLIVIVVLLAVVTTFTNAGSRFVDVELPSAYADYGKAGTVAGILNAVLCLSGAVANTLYGLLAERFGWSVLTWAWILMLAMAVLFCFVAAPLWKRFTKV